MELPDLSPRKIEHIVKSELMPSIEKMDRKTLNELYYLALKKIEEITKDYNKLLDELNHTTTTNYSNDSDSQHLFTPRKYTGTSKPRGIIKRNTTVRSTDGSETTPSFNRDRMTWRFLGKKSYTDEMRSPTPPRKTKTTKGGGGKNKRTIRKRRKAFK